MDERKADQEKRKAERTVDREVAIKLEAVHYKTVAKQMIVEPETEHQEKMDNWVGDMENEQKKRQPAKMQRRPI
jgi:hypothetical protein